VMVKSDLNPLCDCDAVWQAVRGVSNPYQYLHELGSAVQLTVDMANEFSFEDAVNLINHAKRLRLGYKANALCDVLDYCVVSYFPHRTQPDGAMYMASKGFINNLERPPLLFWLSSHRIASSNDDFYVSVYIPKEAMDDFSEGIKYDFYGVFEKSD
jgi:hypothetical protein